MAKEKKVNHIIYSGREETIVCTPENEKKMLKQYFKDGGRDIDEYDRYESFDIAVSVEARTHLQWY